MVGYSEEYELLHFVYDLVMWSALGGTKNSARGVPLWLALKEAPFAPSYWRVRHQALLDMQRQCGMPKLFRTRAPLERSFPYHIWILDEMAKCGKGRQELAGPETLHMAHVLKELDRGYFSGMNRRTAGRADRWWTEHLLGAADGSGTQTVVNFTSRLEFQDGKRKAASQSYHGRGTIHSHSLDFLQNMEQIGLEEKILAVVPAKDEKPLLHGLVMDSQLDRRRSGVPPREEPSAWDPMDEVVLLQHKEEDYALHVRPYFPEAMEVTKCHEDVQQADPHNGALLRYVATYQAKFSNAFAKEWLNDEASDYSIARRVLMDNHPLEPEMWINLATFLFPQCSFGGTLVDIAAPYPGMEEKPEFVLRYEASVWRGPDMSLLEFLRKSNAKGDIIRWVKQQHTRAETADTLEEFARKCECRGEKVIATSCVSRLRDRYYGQWLALHVPFETLEDFLTEEIVARVPERYRLFACALHRAPDYWNDEDRIRKDMRLEASSNDHIDTVCNFIRAQSFLVDQYLTGELDPEDVLDVDMADDPVEAG